MPGLLALAGARSAEGLQHALTSGTSHFWWQLHWKDMSTAVLHCAWLRVAAAGMSEGVECFVVGSRPCRHLRQGSPVQVLQVYTNSCGSVLPCWLTCDHVSQKANFAATLSPAIDSQCCAMSKRSACHANELSKRALHLTEDARSASKRPLAKGLGPLWQLAPLAKAPPCPPGAPWSKRPPFGRNAPPTVDNANACQVPVFGSQHPQLDTTPTLWATVTHTSITGSFLHRLSRRHCFFLVANRCSQLCSTRLFPAHRKVRNRVFNDNGWGKPSTLCGWGNVAGLTLLRSWQKMPHTVTPKPPKSNAQPAVHLSTCLLSLANCRPPAR